MAFLPILLINLIIFIIVLGFFTITGAILIIISIILKQNQLSKRKKAEAEGNFGYVISKKYLIPLVIGIICLVPLILFLGAVIWNFVSSAIPFNTILGQNGTMIMTIM